MVKRLSVVLVLLIGFGIRLYGLTNPPLDFNAVVQLRSALIARGIYYHFITAADPAIRQKAIILGTLEPLEPSILESLVGLTDRLIGSEQIWISRLYTALFWVIGGVALFSLARRVASFEASLLGLGFYMLLPFGVIASRSFQPDPGMVMWILLSAYAFYRWSESTDGPRRTAWTWCLIAGALGGVAILVKVVAGFFIMGMGVAVVFSRIGVRRLFKTPYPWVTAGLTLAPSVLYYIISHGANSANYFTFWTLSFAHMLLTSKFYASWLSMVNSLLSLTTFMAALIGVLVSHKSIQPLLIGLWVGYGLFGLAWPYQYSTHDYYHLPLVAIVGLSLVPLLDWVMRGLRESYWVWRAAAAMVFIFAAGYSVWVARSEILVGNNPSDPIAWRGIGEAIPANSSFVALTGDYGYRLMYYGWRTPTANWPGLDSIDMQQAQGDSPLDTQSSFATLAGGKDYFLVTDFSALKQQPQLKDLLYANYPVYKQGDGYILFDLKHRFSSPQPVPALP